MLYEEGWRDQQVGREKTGSTGHVKLHMEGELDLFYA